MDHKGYPKIMSISELRQLLIAVHQDEERREEVAKKQAKEAYDILKRAADEVQSAITHLMNQEGEEIDDAFMEAARSSVKELCTVMCMPPPEIPKRLEEELAKALLSEPVHAKARAGEPKAKTQVRYDWDSLVPPVVVVGAPAVQPQPEPSKKDWEKLFAVS
jgi:ribosomal protein L16 Arg81 hydroxylase